MNGNTDRTPKFYLVYEKEGIRMKARKKVLIADDDGRIHDLLNQVLRGDMFDIIHAYDGQETLEVAEDELPDLIVLDIMMPLIDGRDICRQLKRDPETECMKVMMLSGRDEQHDRILGLQLGADDYVAKPASVHYVARRIRHLLQEQRPTYSTT
jgi:DNA-binding response OmpR family regulator